MVRDGAMTIEPFSVEFEIQVQETNCLWQNLREEKSLEHNLRENRDEIEQLTVVTNTYGRCTQDSPNAKRMQGDGM